MNDNMMKRNQPNTRICRFRVFKFWRIRVMNLTYLHQWVPMYGAVQIHNRRLYFIDHFHRDVTSSQYEFKTEYPTYTFITYDHEGPALSVCPGSHRTAPLLVSQPMTVNSKYVLFNCDVVHAGSLNLKKLPRKAIQYKIVHKNDLIRLKHLNGIDKVKKGDCTKRNNPVLDVMYRKLSILFSYIVNHQLTPYLQSRESNVICKLFGEERCFYNK